MPLTRFSVPGNVSVPRFTGTSTPRTTFQTPGTRRTGSTSSFASNVTQDLFSQQLPDLIASLIGPQTNQFSSAFDPSAIPQILQPVTNATPQLQTQQINQLGNAAQSLSNVLAQAQTQPPPQPQPAPQPAPGGSAPAPAFDTQLRDAVRAQESGGDYNAVGDNGASFGAYQFQVPTWQFATTLPGAAAGVAHPQQATPAQQDATFDAYMNYLLQLHNGDQTLALAEYNGGAGGIQASLNNGYPQAVLARLGAAPTGVQQPVAAAQQPPAAVPSEPASLAGANIIGEFAPSTLTAHAGPFAGVPLVEWSLPEGRRLDSRGPIRIAQGSIPGHSALLEAFPQVQAGSDYRTFEQQSDLFAQAQAGLITGPGAAVPGTSFHEHGTAIDYVNLPIGSAEAAAFEAQAWALGAIEVNGGPNDPAGPYGDGHIHVAFPPTGTIAPPVVAPQLAQPIQTTLAATPLAGVPQVVPQPATNFFSGIPSYIAGQIGSGLSGG